MNYIGKVIELLEEEYKVFERVLELCNKKTKCIVENNVSDLIVLLNQERKEAEQLSKLEEERTNVMDLISKQVSTPILNIDGLARITSQQEWDRIADLRARLEKIIFEVRKVNHLNRSLILSALEYIDFMSNVISMHFSDDTIYQKDGHTGSQKKNFFDVKL